MSGCGCGGGTGLVARPIHHPEHRWRGGQVVRQGAVGPELEAEAANADRAGLSALLGRVAQAWNGQPSRRTTRDLPGPVALRPIGGTLDDVEIDPPGVERGDTSSATRLPEGWWQTWDGEYDAGRPEEVG